MHRWLLLIIMLVLLARGVPTALACTLPAGGLPPYSLSDHIDLAGVILVGNITAIEGMQTDHTAVIEVEQYLKGDGPATIRVSGFGDSAMCRQSVSVGRRMIFFAGGDPQTGLLYAAYFSMGSAAFGASDQTIANITAITGTQVFPDQGAGSVTSPSASPDLVPALIVVAGALVLLAGIGIFFVQRRKMR